MSSRDARRLAIERRVYYSRNDPDNLREFLLAPEPTLCETREQFQERRKAQFEKDMCTIRSFDQPQHQEKNRSCKKSEEMLRNPEASQKNTTRATFETTRAGNETKNDDSSTAPSAARRKPIVVRKNNSRKRPDFHGSDSNIICPAALDEQHNSRQSTSITLGPAVGVYPDGVLPEEPWAAANVEGVSIKNEPINKSKASPAADAKNMSGKRARLETEAEI